MWCLSTKCEDVVVEATARELKGKGKGIANQRDKHLFMDMEIIMWLGR